MASKSSRSYGDRGRRSRYGNDDAAAPAPAATPAAPASADRSKIKWNKKRLAARKRSVRTRTGSNHRDPVNGRYA